MATRRKDVVGEGESSDSDEVPEDVSLSRGREEALKAHRVAAKESRRAAATLKERRKRREELFTAQKEEKKQLKRFPVSDLKEVLRMEADKAEVKDMPKSKVTKRKRRRSKEWTPTEHEFDSVKVVALGEGDRAPPVAAGRDAVLNFVQQQLYHSTRYKRVPVLSFQAQRYTDRPARNFV